MTANQPLVGTLTDMEEAMLTGAGYDPVVVLRPIYEDGEYEITRGWVAVVTRSGDKVVESLGDTRTRAVVNALRSVFR